MVPGGERRLVKGEQTRQRLLSCAVEEILASGPDRLGFTSIARRADLTTGALYARYENCDELLIDVWNTVCVPTLGRVLWCLTEGLASDARADSRAELARIVQGEPAALVATVSLLVAARRNEALRDDVDPSFSDMVDKAAAENPLVPHFLAMLAGIVLHSRSSDATVSDWSPVTNEMFEMSDHVLGLSAMPAEREVSPTVRDLQFTPLSEQLDDIDFKLFAAVVHVVNRAGVDKATVARIARRSNLNPAVIYTRYADKDDLIYRCIRIGLMMGVARNQRLLEQFSLPLNSGEMFANVMRSNAEPGNEPDRLFRLESIHAAGHHERLRELMSGTRERISSVYATVSQVPDVWNYPTIWPFVVINRAIMHGQSLMLAFGYMAAEDPFIPIVTERLTGAMSRNYLDTVGTWDNVRGVPHPRG